MRFFAGGNTHKTETWFWKGGSEPYQMVIPGYRVFASRILGWMKVVGTTNILISTGEFQIVLCPYNNDPAPEFSVGIRP